ncbi:hypothetical protein [Leisingera sp. M523]|uniref:hypothetical protein n=1 Tax=Leisingera sp. M523 TaxID=2867013 RepID=UPI0021A760BA|nr:hypothetical protein [Leisingera sp. M523]UWQ30208.1 hypothetical protein K3557_06640 [Leisingera sp. M523]
MTHPDTSTAAVEARCQHLDYVAHDRNSQDAALMRALAAERDALEAKLEATLIASETLGAAARNAGERDGRKAALEEAIAVCERGDILTADSAAAHLRHRRALQPQQEEG